MEIELTREDGTKFTIETDRIKAYGSTDSENIKRNYLIVEHNDRIYCKEGYDEINRIIKITNSNQGE